MYLHVIGCMTGFQLLEGACAYQLWGPPSLQSHTRTLARTHAHTHPYRN